MPQPHPVLDDASANRGRRFPLSLRHHLDLHGLVHPAPPLSLLNEIAAVLRQLNDPHALPNDLARFEYLMRLLRSDEHLFFAIAQSNLSRILPLIYTPTVAEACLHFPLLDIPLRGLWLSAPLIGSIETILRKHATRGAPVDVVVVTDGQRILGLGDLGANGMPIPVGKLLLYSACAGVHPSSCLPVLLDVGCDTLSVRRSPHYVGIPTPRLTGPHYDAFVHEFVTAVSNVFGPSCLIQFEDFGNANAARLLEKYRYSHCCFNDDIQGTAAVVVAGILASLRVPGVESQLSKHLFLFVGAGSAALGIAHFIVLALHRLGLSIADARRRCWFVDSKGIIVAGRSSLTPSKAIFAHSLPNSQTSPTSDLLEIVNILRPTALIGVSTIAAIFSAAVIRRMADLNRRPIIFALSNPTSKSECSAADAYKHSHGRAVFAAGSPFPAVKLPHIPDPFTPPQGNNSYIFPGLGLGIILSKARLVPDSIFLTAADKLASLVDDNTISRGCVYPPLTRLLDVSAHIALAVCQHSQELGINARDVSHLDTVDAVRSHMYRPFKDDNDS